MLEEKNNLKKVNEINSLNDNLFDEFYIQELESRFETDPLTIFGISDFTVGSDDDIATPLGCFVNSGEVSCGADCTINVDLCSCILDII